MSSNDIVYRISICPPFTKYYLTMLIVSSFFINYIKILPVYWYFAFSIKQIVHNFQIWRFFTNFLIGGSFSFGYILMLYGLFNTLSELEKEGIKHKKLASFCTQIFYLIFIIIIISFINKYCFGIEESRSLLNELTYSFYSLRSYRDPNTYGLSLYYFPIKNKYAPFAVFFISVCAGNEPSQSIVGIISGYIYVILGDILEDKYNITIFYTPQWLIKILKDKDNKVIKIKREKPKEEPMLNMNLNNTQNTNLRKTENVAEGNEYKDTSVSIDNIKWE